MLVICSMQICLQMFHLGEVTNYLHLSSRRQAFQSWARNEIEERSYSNQFSVVFETEPIILVLHCKHFMNCDQWTAVSLLNGLIRNPVFSKLSFTRVSEMGKKSPPNSCSDITACNFACQLATRTAKQLSGAH